MSKAATLPPAMDIVDDILQKPDTEDITGLYDLYYQISTALHDYRTAQSLSQSGLAKKLGVSQAMVSKLESGNYNYTLEQLWKLARKMDFQFEITFAENITKPKSKQPMEQETDRQDLSTYNKYMKKHLKNPVTYAHAEALKVFELDK